LLTHPFIEASPLYFADTLTRLFENIATIIDQHQPLVESHYGRGKMLRVIQRLEEEADLQSDRLLDQFLQVRKMDAKVSYKKKTKKKKDGSLSVFLETHCPLSIAQQYSISHHCHDAIQHYVEL
jgi:hypothetical protein